MIEPVDNSRNFPPATGSPGTDRDSGLKGLHFSVGRAIVNKQLLEGSEVFVLDDTRSDLMLGSRLLAACLDAPSGQIHTINPAEVAKLYEGEVDQKAMTLQAVVSPIVAAVRDPERRVSLVLSDFEMGAITGAVIAQELRSQLGAKLPFKFILNSANPELATKTDSFYDIFIAKPIGVDSLRAAVAAVLLPES